MITINYEDVCQNDNVINHLKEHFEIEQRGKNDTGYNGYANMNYEGVTMSVKVDRHATYAGNQYIKIYTFYHNEVKIPLNTPFNLSKIKKKLSKLAEKEKVRLLNLEDIQKFREKIYKKFNEINTNKNLTVSIQNKEISITGRFSHYYQTTITYRDMEKDIENIRKYFKKYETEKKEIESLLNILKKA